MPPESPDGLSVRYDRGRSFPILPNHHFLSFPIVSSNYSPLSPSPLVIHHRLLHHCIGKFPAKRLARSFLAFCSSSLKRQRRNLYGPLLIQLQINQTQASTTNEKNFILPHGISNHHLPAGVWHQVSGKKTRVTTTHDHMLLPASLQTN